MKNAAIVKRRRDNKDTALSREERYFLRTRDVHPLVGSWQKIYPDRYSLYMTYRDFMLTSEDIDLNDLEVHQCAVGLVLHDFLHIKIAEDGLNELDLSQDQLRAMDIVRKYRDTSLKMVRESKRLAREETALSSLRAILHERDAKVREITVREIDIKGEAKEMLVDYEVE